MAGSLGICLDGDEVVDLLLVDLELGYAFLLEEAGLVADLLGFFIKPRVEISFRCIFSILNYFPSN